MSMVKVEVEVPEALYKLANGLGLFAVDVKKAVADGFKLGDDLAPLVASAMMNLVPAMAGLSEIPADAKADPAASVEALIIGLRPALKEILA